MAQLEAAASACQGFIDGSLFSTASCPLRKSAASRSFTCVPIRKHATLWAPQKAARCQRRICSGSLEPAPQRSTPNDRQERRVSNNGTTSHNFIARPGQSTQLKERAIAAEAIPAAVSAVVAFGAVVTAGIALANLPKEKVAETLGADKPKCEACGGSGICPVCRGEGFVNKELTPQEREKARARSTMAATRYTAGLAKKWRYCIACNGSRGCTTCQGLGYLDKEPEKENSTM